MLLIRLIVKTLLVMFLLPALGLITLTGGLGTSIGTVILVALGSVGATLVLLPLLATGGVLSVLAGGVLGGRFGAFLVGFAIHTGITAIALGFAAWLLPGIALLGFWPTMGAAAILGLAGSLLTPHNSN